MPGDLPDHLPHDPPVASLILDAAGLAYRLHRHPPVRGAADHALSGLPLESSAKTLAFELPGGDVALVALPGAAALAYGDLARALGVSRSALRPASAEVLGALGMSPGGVCPLTSAEHARVVIDPAVLDLPVVYCGSGDPGATIEISPEALRQACPTAIVAAVSR